MISSHQSKSNSGRGKHGRTFAILGSLILAAGIGATEMRIGNHRAPVSGVLPIGGGNGGLALTAINETNQSATTANSKIVEGGIEGTSGSINGAQKTNQEAATATAAPPPTRRAGAVAFKTYIKLRLDIIRVPPFITWRPSSPPMNDSGLRLFPLTVTFGRQAIPTEG